MAANMRATPPPSSSGRHGSTLNVVGSGIAIMSDSSIALKPVIEDQSKPSAPHAPPGSARPPREHVERGRVGHRDHVRLLDRVEAGDRGPVEAHPALER